jgi:hypothetical protein
MRLLLALCLLLAACGPEPFVERPTQLVFSPGTTGFWSVPLPSELRRQQDGTSDLDRWPGARPALVKMWLDTIDDRLRDGWGVNAGAFFTVSSALDAASLPSAEASLTAEASVQWVDIDPSSPEYGRRFPLDVRFTADAITYRPANLLAVTPVQGFPRRGSTMYAVLITDAVRDANGQALGRSRAFHDALEQLDGADARAAETLKPLRAWLDASKFPRARVVGATVFRTLDPNVTLRRLAAWVETLPTPTLEEPWTLAETFDDFVLYTARYRVPHVQSGPRPGRGRIVWDGEVPVQQGTQSVRLSLAMPKTAPPAAGQPVMLYFHGSGGEYREAVDRGPLPPTAPRRQQGEPPLGSGPVTHLARRGLATIGFDFPLHGDRETPPDTTGLKLYDLFGDIDSTVDNMSVAAMEAVYLSRLVETLTLPVPSGGTARVDMARLTAMGHSMGSTIGIPVATVDPRIKGYVFSGAGGLLLEVATTATYPVDLRTTLELLLGFQQGEVLDRAHPLLHAFQALWDLTDPVAKARHVTQEPHPGHAPKPWFLPQGFIDGYFHPGAQAAIAGALGTTLVGESLDATVARTLRLAGRDAVATFPLAGNLNGVTAGTTQRQTPFELGHYIMFDVAETAAQVGCFLTGVGGPGGPRLVSSRPLDAPCD